MSEKEAFEAWFKKTHGYSALTDYDGSYEGPWTSGAWEAWKARAIPEGSVLVPRDVLERMVDTMNTLGLCGIGSPCSELRQIIDQQVKP